MTSRFASLTEQVIEKIVEDKDTQNTKRPMKWLRSCSQITWKRKNWANLGKRKSWHKIWRHAFYVEARKERIRWMYNKQLLNSVFVISRMIKVSVRVISLSLRFRLIAPTSTLIILDITKTSSNNCLKSLLFSLRLRVCVCLFIRSRKRKLAGPGGVFPAFSHATFHHASITCCNVARSGYIWF